ncbi:IS256 family transposase, variant Zn-binding type [Psychrobacter faecalis]|uniref:IS256 family transposase, variant Zn-binding type n=1 Tax=Psychrobacter faecalis TaxID=180588 RepID=UPI003FD6477F
MFARNQRHESKNCPFCRDKHTKKNGRKLGKQQYQCLACRRQFLGGKRLNNQTLWTEYTQGKQTYQQLADKYHCSIKTIQRRLDKVSTQYQIKQPKTANIIMDTTYFGRKFGLMVFMDNTTKAVLYYAIVSHETNSAYKQGVDYLVSLGVDIQSITCDGRRGLRTLFTHTPCQMCQFHQVQIVTRYLTRRPKNSASIELRRLTLEIKLLDKEAFIQRLDHWYVTHEAYLNERSTNDDNSRTWYTHKRLRSAYRSLRTNSDWLFTYQKYGHLDIPNTTNSLEGLFSELKRQLHSHHGLSEQRKLRFIKDFLGLRSLK